MTALIDRLFKAMEFLLVALLAAMVVMVFGNVVLRYTANSGILVSEELSRFFFVWLTFIGAVVAMREGAHLGVDTMVKVLPRVGKLVCAVASELLMLLCCGVFFWGTWQQAEVNASNYSPVTGLSMIWVFGIGFFTSGAIALIVLHRLFRIFTGRASDDELIQVRESEETTGITREGSAR
jgi:TRAP-type C4-dicarboxylate transport system permease small subunit